MKLTQCEELFTGQDTGRGGQGARGKGLVRNHNKGVTRPSIRIILQLMQGGEKEVQQIKISKLFTFELSGSDKSSWELSLLSFIE